MYQFSEMFSEINPQENKPTRRWLGFFLGLVGGWIPAWMLSHWVGGGGWSFAGTWILALPLGYGIGNLVKK